MILISDRCEEYSATCWTATGLNMSYLKYSNFLV